MKIIPVTADSFGSNSYIILSDREALVVDPSASVDRILKTVDNAEARLSGILLTHGHFDHIISLDTLRERTHVPAFIHKNDAIMLTDGKKNAFYDFFGKERRYAQAERLLSDKDTITLGKESITVLHTPGHTMGSVCYMCGDSLITGDTLFAETFGRCDLWGGDITAMGRSLSSLRQLPSNTRIYPGHGQSARLGDALDNVAYLMS